MKVFSIIFCLALLFPSLGNSWTISSFNPHCDKFFYKKFQPTGLIQTNSEVARICQCYQGGMSFATLYNKPKHIALYSAYVYVGNNEPNPETTPLCGPKLIDPAHVCGDGDWCVEPGLAGIDGNDRKSIENGPGENLPDFEKFHRSQAVDQDYRLQTTPPPRYTRAHLNPNGHHQNVLFRSSTYTLTNAVPQIQALNQLWAENYENNINRLFAGCSRMYILTGSVPSARNFMTSNINNLGYENVNIPDAIWSAYCCVDNNDRPIRSGGHWLQNKAGSTVNRPSLARLQETLSKAFGRVVELFQNNCI